LVYVSPLNRTQETLKIVREFVELKDDQIVTDERLQETQTGMNGLDHDKFWDTFGSLEKVYENNPKGETLIDIRKRVGSFLEEIDKKHESKNILVISHGWPLWMMKAFCDGWTKEEAIENKKEDDYLKTGEVEETILYRLPHNRNFELDLHRPYIDRVTFEENGKKFTRIKDVFGRLG
jgi:isoleucyl-tRNA synthetase